MIIIEDATKNAIHYIPVSLRMVGQGLPVYLDTPVNLEWAGRNYHIIAMDNAANNVVVTCLGWCVGEKDVRRTLNSNLRDTYDSAIYTFRWLLEDKLDGTLGWYNVVINATDRYCDVELTLTPIGNQVCTIGGSRSKIVVDILRKFYNLDILPPAIIQKMINRMYPIDGYVVYVDADYSIPLAEDITDADYELITNARKAL